MLTSSIATQTAQVKRVLTTHLQPPSTLHRAQLYPLRHHPPSLHTPQNSSHLHTCLPPSLHRYHQHPQICLPSEPDIRLQSPPSTIMKTLHTLSARHTTQPQLSVPQAPPPTLPTPQPNLHPPLTTSAHNGTGHRPNLLLPPRPSPPQAQSPNQPHQNTKYLKTSGTS